MPSPQTFSIFTGRKVYCPFDNERYALRAYQVDVGDIVYVAETDRWWIVSDTDSLNTDDGYFAVGSIGGGGGSITVSGYTTATGKILGRTTSGSGAIEELTPSAVLDLIGSTRGSILYRGASGWSILAPGTSGYVLTSNGSGADPSYQAGGGGGGGGTWGSITGTLSDQTDLQSALDAKVPVTRTVNGQALSGNITITTITGNAGTATALATARAINGVNFDGTAAITVPAAAGTLTGTTLASNVLSSSLTSLGTITSLTASAMSVTGVATYAGAFVKTANAMGALAIDVSKIYNTKSISADSTFTFSGTPGSTNQWFGLLVTNTDTNAHALTIPSSFSINRNGAITSITIPASGKLFLNWNYDGSTYTIYGDPVATTGTGNFVLNSGAQQSITASFSSDNSYSGTTITGLNAGATISQWDIVYLGSSSTWLVADADGSGTYPACGMAIAAYSSTNPATVLARGTVRHDAWNWTPGGRLYLSTTAGGLTQTPPASSGDKVQDVGFALTADVAYLDFDGVYLAVA
jgi:hypothetical protein